MNLEELDDLLDDHPKDEVKDDDKIIKAPLIWHGSKSRSIEELRKHLPYSNVFVDVCGGSGVVTLNRRPSKKLDVYNDRWSGVSDFYRCVQDKVKMELMLDKLSLLINSKEIFYEYKQTWETTTDEVDRACKWYYMVQNSYGGLGRNWGFGKNSFINRYKERLPLFPVIQRRFEEIQVENEDFREILHKYDSPWTVFYIDPPYVNSEQAGSYHHKFTEQDHYDLIEASLHCKGFVAISHRPNDLYDKQRWSRTAEWEIQGSNHGGQTESNHRIGADVAVKRIEKLYIKDFA